VREVASDTVGDERMHVAGRVQPTMREGRIGGMRMQHELAEMRFDTCGLPEAHEVRDYGHSANPLIATLPLRES
jgi:hypothetical protein